jgi:hypothetical protein
VPASLAGAILSLQLGCASFEVGADDASPSRSDLDRDGAPAEPGADGGPVGPHMISVSIPAGEGWVDTGLGLAAGEHVRVTAEGAVQFDESVTAVGPAGSSDESWQAWNIVLCVNHASLIGRVGDGEPFFIGEQALFAATREGNLFLGLNDSNLTDNTGDGFQAAIETDVDYQTITTGPVYVSGSTTWTDTGIDVVAGNQLTVSASGRVVVNGSQDCDPAGLPDRPDYDVYEPIPCADHAALIARVGESGDVFLIGRSESVAVPAAGRLYLGINDTDVGNNSGAFAAAVTVTDPAP